MSGLVDAFSATYAQARARFLESAAAAGMAIESFVHPLVGRDGETLAMDVARDGPADARLLLVVSSEADVGDWEPLPNPIPRPEPYVHEDHEFDASTLEIREIRASGEVTSYTGADVLNDDGGLQRALDAEAAAIDRAIRGGADDEDDDDGEDGYFGYGAEDERDSERFMAETRLMDECLEHGEQTPFLELLGDRVALPRPESLSDTEVEAHLKIVLSQLALFGVAFAVCDHCTPREAYRILLDEVLPDCGAYEDLIGTEWVQHFMTHEYCAECDAEAELNYRKYAEESGE